MVTRIIRYRSFIVVFRPAKRREADQIDGCFPGNPDADPATSEVASYPLEAQAGASVR
jgi:hypothetical protein